jgi:hypothetical protein
VKSGLWVSKAVVTVNKTNTVPLKILNPSNDTIFVPRGKVIATFQCFTTDFNLLNPRVDTNVCAQDVQLQSESSECESRFDSKFISYFDIPAHLSADEKQKLMSCLEEHKDLIVTDENPKLGYTEIVKHNICLKPDYKRKYQQPYRLTPDKKNVLRDHLDELLEQGIIVPVQESEDIPITSPIVLVLKKTRPKQNDPSNKSANLSKCRFCCDFRYLNSQAQAFRYSIPNLQDLTESFSDRKPAFLTCIDLSSGFFQLSITSESQHFTAFNTCFGTFKFLRLPMGLSSAPASMQLLMDKVLNDLTFRSDHQALKPLFQKQLKGAIYERWIAILQQFNFELRYEPGKEMQVPDALSRIPNSSDKIGFESPDQDDPYLPYYSENVGNMITPEGKIFSNLLVSESTDNENQINNVSTLPIQFNSIAPNDKILDLAYDGETEENDNYIPKQRRKNPRVRKLKINKQLVPSCAKYKPSENVTEHSNTRTTDSACSAKNETISDEIQHSTIQNQENEENTELQVNDLDDSVAENSSHHTNESSVSTQSDETAVEHFISDNQQTIAKQMESSDIFKNSEFNPESLRKLQQRDPYFGSIYRYLTENEMPKSQSKARKLLPDVPDYVLFESVLFHTRIAKSKRTKLLCQYQLALPEIAVKSVISLYHDSPMGGHSGIQATLDLIKEHYYFPLMSQKVSDYIKS